MSATSQDVPTSSPTAFLGPQPPSNLYLITFLATLFLLLFVSCGIVLRSYILRRRYQRGLQEALGSGLLLTPRTQGSKRKRLGAKPKMINVWLAEGGEKWNQMMPLSAQPVFVKRKIRDNPAKQNSPSDTMITTQPSTTAPDATAADSSNASRSPLTSSTHNNGSNKITNLFSRFRRSQSQGTESAQPNADGIKQPISGPNYRVRVEMLQLSVLIAMPSRNKSEQKNHILEDTDPNRDEEDETVEDSELPNMVFGVTRVNYRQPKSTPSSTLPPLPKM